VRRVMGFLLGGLLFLPTAVWAKTVKTRCSSAHSVRLNGMELRSTSVIFNNGDLDNSTTIQRLTIRDFFGNVVHDSGPALGVLHPLNTDFDPDVDITVIPPGATFYIRTNHIWGNNPIPIALGGNSVGQSMSVTVEASKEGNPNLFVVGVRPRSRERIFDVSTGNFAEGKEASTNDGICFKVHRSKEQREDPGDASVE